jgi:hypothetical protein
LRLFPIKRSDSNYFLLKRPRNAMGDSPNDPMRRDFDRGLKLEFHGSTVTSDAGLLAYRELHDARARTSNAATGVHDTRTGQNTQHGGSVFWGKKLAMAPPGFRIKRWCRSRGPGQGHLGKIGQWAIGAVGRGRDGTGGGNALLEKNPCNRTFGVRITRW